MAQSRLEKIGTIFTRVSGLLRSGAMKQEDKPIWYDVYEAFPPKQEPRFDRPAPSVPIKNIFYEEDVVRAKYHKSLKHHEMVNLVDFKHDTNSQQFIKIYNQLRAEGALDQEQVFATSLELLAEQKQQMRTDVTAASTETGDGTDIYSKPSLADLFIEAKNTAALANKPSTPKEQTQQSETKKATTGINIQSLFKE